MELVTAAILFGLLVVYQIKHFLADYPLQGQFMLGKFSKDWKVWIPALSAHAGIHAWFTLTIAVYFMDFFRPDVNWRLAIWLAVLDFVVHFTMDRIKASPDMLGRFKPLDANSYMNMLSIIKEGNESIKVLGYPENYNTYVAAIKRMRHNSFFWWALGFDQMVHHLTHYGIIYLLLGLS